MTLFEKQKLPAGWHCVKLGEAGEVGSGITLGRNVNRSSKTRLVPYLRVANVKDGYLDLSDMKMIEATEAEIEKCSLRPGDLLLTEGGDPDKLGRGTVWNAEVPECLHQNHIFRVRFPQDKFSPEFLSALMSSDYGKAYFLAHAKQTTGIASINQKVLKAFPLLVPPPSEQRRIASILAQQMTAVEKARISAQERLQAAKELPAAYVREVFESEDARTWPRRAFGEVCCVTAPIVDPRKERYSGLPHIFGNNIESGLCCLKYLNSAEEDGMTSGKYLFKVGDVLYSKLRPYLRKVVVAECDGLCSADMYPIEVDSNILDPYFTAWMLLSDEFTNYADEQSRRSRMPKLNRDQLFAWQAPIPPLTVQKQLMERHRGKITQVEMLLGLVREELEKINQMSAAVLRRAFQGEL